MDRTTEETLERWGLALTEEQANRLELFRVELLEKNARLNLFSRRSDADLLWPRHILDALAGAPLLSRLVRPGGLVADAGAGAGFPGIPLAVALEEMRFDLWDSSMRRQMFLTWTASRLKLGNARGVCARIGQSGGTEAGRYDAVVERAMGKLENILPQCLNMLRPGGVFLAWQSESGEGAAAEAVEAFSYRLPNEDKERFILVFRKG